MEQVSILDMFGHVLTHVSNFILYIFFFLNFRLADKLHLFVNLGTLETTFCIFLRTCISLIQSKTPMVLLETIFLFSKCIFYI